VRRRANTTWQVEKFGGEKVEGRGVETQATQRGSVVAVQAETAGGHDPEKQQSEEIYPGHTRLPFRRHNVLNGDGTATRLRPRVVRGRMRNQGPRCSVMNGTSHLSDTSSVGAWSRSVVRSTVAPNPVQSWSNSARDTVEVRWRVGDASLVVAESIKNDPVVASPVHDGREVS